jgi:hypothetical protein
MLDSFLALAGKKRITASLDIATALLSLERALAELNGIDTEDR